MSEPGERSARKPWNKGLALTTTPSLSTSRRWLEAAVAEGMVERKAAEPDGKPGRPPVLYTISEAGRAWAAKQPRLPPGVQLERARRLENARKRRGQQRRAKAANAAGQKVAKAERKLKAAQVAAEKARAALLTMEIVYHGIKALAEAGGDPSALLPEEADVLLETGCAVMEDGQLVPAADIAEKLEKLCG